MTTAAAALSKIQRLAAAGRVSFTKHARRRMQERGAKVADVLAALRGATRCRAEEDGKWRVSGLDIDGDDLTAIVVVEADVLVITMF